MRLADQLPRVMAEDPFLRRFLRILDEVSGGVQVHADALADWADLSVTTDEMVLWLAYWIGLDSLAFDLPPDRRREFVRRAGRLLAWRGTARAVQGLLELLTDRPVTVRESGGVFSAGTAPVGPSWLVVDLEDLGPLDASQAAAVALAHAPLHVGFELTVRGQPVAWEPPPGRAAPLPVPPEVLAP